MRFFAGLTLWKKIALLGSVGMLVGIGIFSALAVRALNQAVDTMLQDRLTLARQGAAYIDESMSHFESQVAVTAEAIASSDLTEAPTSQVDSLESVADQLSIDIRDVYVVDSAGTIVWSQTGNEGALALSKYPSIEAALSGNSTAVSGLVRLPGIDTPVALVSDASGVVPGNGHTALVVAIDVDKSGMAGLVRPVKLGNTGYVVIVDRSGALLSTTQANGSSGDAFAAMLAGLAKPGLPEAMVKGGEVLAFAPLSAAPWGVVVLQSEGEAFAPIRGLGQDLALAGAAVVLITVLLMTVVTRSVVNRILMLTTASNRIAQGDLSTPVPADSNRDELGGLAQTLDEMRTKLGKSYDELEHRTNQLAALLSVSELLASVPSLADLETALDAALARTIEITKADAAGILIWQEDRQAFCYRAYRGLSQEYVTAMCCRAGEGIVGRVAQSGEAIQVADISVDARVVGVDLVVAEGLKGLASVPLRSRLRVLGVLNVATRDAHLFLPDEIRLLESIGGQIATALENVRLHEEVQHKEEIRGEVLGEMFSIQEEERRRIARELHDETSQVLASLTANLEAVAHMLPSGQEKATALIRKTQDLSVRILDEIHRLIYELRPSLLDDMGLVPATRWLIENSLTPSGVIAEFRPTGKARRLPPDLEAMLFRVIQEALTNVARHSHANKARVGISFRKKSLAVHIRDDGQGFDVEEALNARDRPRGLGLLGMRERVELVKGTLKISSEPGGGTDIHVVVPASEEGYNGQNKSTGR